MRKLFLLSIVLSGLTAQAQYQQNVFQPSDTIVHAVTAIDSIRFNVATGTYEIVLTNGNSEAYPIAAIDSVNFQPSETPQESCVQDGVLNGNIIYGLISDADGNAYSTVTIGNREWMAENLRSSHYANGDIISMLEDNALWSNTNEGAACWYLNDSSSYSCPQGKLYNWFAVSDPRNVCPSNWHVPTDTELSELINYLDANAAGGANANNAGGKMKSIFPAYWSEPNIGATNESGLSVIGAGYRSSVDGSYSGGGFYTYLWSSTQDASYSAWEQYISNNDASSFRGSAGKKEGFSVRCVRD